MKEKSIFRKVLFSNLKIMLIPILITMLLIGYYMSSRLTESIKEDAYENVYNYFENFSNEMEKTLAASESTVRFPLIYSGLSRKFENSYEVVTFLQDAKVFLENITHGLDNSVIMVCFDNETLFEDKYFVKVQNVKNHKEIIKTFAETNINVLWDENIYIDENGNDYIVFYEDTELNKGCFIMGKVYIPQNDYDIRVVKKGVEIKDENKEIRLNINEHFDIVVPIDYEAISRRNTQVFIMFLLTTILIIVLLFLVTQKTTTKVTKGISNFISSLDASDITEDKLDLEVRSGDVKEIAVIKGKISELLERIEEMTESRYKTEIEKSALEFELLQSQIDPHTLYNSLSAIRLGAFKRNDDEMVEFVDTMVSYYRKVLNKGKPMYSLSEELDLTSKYVKINEMSHYKKYNLSIEAEEDILDTEVLHLILQPFAENAIIHGLGGSQSHCLIKIICSREDESLKIVIFDNGRGMDDVTLEKLNDLENSDIGYGIRNAYMRLKLFYGDAVSIKFESREQEGTKVTIKFPQKYEKNRRAY